MKHFFFPYNKNPEQNDKLNFLIDSYIFSIPDQDGEENKKINETLKAYCDVTDTIFDILVNEMNCQIYAACFIS